MYEFPLTSLIEIDVCLCVLFFYLEAGTSTLWQGNMRLGVAIEVMLPLVSLQVETNMVRTEHCKWV